MTANVHVLSIGALQSDGVSTNRPRTEKGFNQCDEYFRKKLARQWAKHRKDISDKTNVIIDRLPDGYAGFEKARDRKENQKCQIDRFVYGHPNGRFDSLVKFYAHFKHLVDKGSSLGCSCVLCSIPSLRTSTTSSLPLQAKSDGIQVDDKEIRKRPLQQVSKYSTNQHANSLSPDHHNEQVNKKARVCLHIDAVNNEVSDFNLDTDVQSDTQSEVPGKKEEHNDSQSVAHGKKDVDDDAHELQEMLDSPETKGHDLEKDDCESVRSTEAQQTVLCEEQPIETSDSYRQLYRLVSHYTAGDEFDQPLKDDVHWPVNSLSIEAFATRWLDMPSDLPRIGEVVLYTTKRNSNSLSGSALEAGFVVYYRAERSEDSIATRRLLVQSLGNDNAQSYVTVSQTRPMQYWRVCMQDVDSASLPWSLQQAMKVTNSSAVVSPYRLQISTNDRGRVGSINCHGFYLGHELLLVGDIIKLLPASLNSAAVVDVMQITRIKLKLSQSDHGVQHTCLHVVGRTYTSDPLRSYGGFARHPVSLPGLTFEDEKQWYHALDPEKPKIRLEIPYYRILGRCYGHKAVEGWLDADRISANQQIVDQRILEGLSIASKYTVGELNSAWVWSETRFEQFGLDPITAPTVTQFERFSAEL